MYVHSNWKVLIYSRTNASTTVQQSQFSTCPQHISALLTQNEVWIMTLQTSLVQRLQFYKTFHCKKNWNSSELQILAVTTKKFQQFRTKKKGLTSSEPLLRRECCHDFDWVTPAVQFWPETRLHSWILKIGFL